MSESSQNDLPTIFENFRRQVTFNDVASEVPGECLRIKCDKLVLLGLQYIGSSTKILLVHSTRGCNSDRQRIHNLLMQIHTLDKLLYTNTF